MPPLTAAAYSLPPHLQLVVESFCNDGCKAVYAYITAIENGEPLLALQGLTTTERTLVVTELKSIMAVYGRCKTEALSQR